MNQDKLAQSVGLLAMIVACWNCHMSIGAEASLKTTDTDKTVIKQQQELIDQLVYAATEGKLEQVKDLTARGVDVNGESSDYFSRNGFGYGNTPLTVAVSGGHIEVVRFLVSKGANVAQADRYEGQVNMTPVQAAAGIGRADIADLLIEHGAQMDIYSAAGLGRTNDVAKLLAKNPELVRKKNRNGDCPLNFTVAVGEGPTDTAAFRWIGRLACAEILLKRGADVNAENNARATALHGACASNAKYRLVELLVASGANVNAVNANGQGYTPLSLASHFSTKKVVEFLLSKGADPKLTRTSDGETPLHWVFNNRNSDWSETAELLIVKGFDVNKRSDTGWTPLHAAAGKGNTNIVRLLIEKGADINAATNEGDTPLHIAVQRRHTNTVAILVAKGADVNLKNKKGQTPLDFARSIGFARDIASVYTANGIKTAKEAVSAEDLVRMMESNDPNKWDKVKAMVEENPAALNVMPKASNLTPFAEAVCKGDADIVEFLIEKGGDVMNPQLLSLAANFNKSDVVRLLRAKGARQPNER